VDFADSLEHPMKVTATAFLGSLSLFAQVEMPTFRFKILTVVLITPNLPKSVIAMKSRPRLPNNLLRPVLGLWLVISLTLAGLVPSAQSVAQPPLPSAANPPLPIAGPATQPDLPPPLDDDQPFGVQPRTGLPVIGVEAPRPVAPFIDRLRANDAAFEVIVGQGRILTTKEEITAGQVQALIAVGDPSVIEFTVISARQIRITGQRVGVTDLSISTGAGNTYNFEVRVVTDLEPLAAKLAASFPDANLRLAQLRENVIVEGQARDAPQVTNIIRMITAYLESVQTGQAGGTTTSQPSRGPGNFPNGNNPNTPSPTPVDPNQPATSPGAATPLAGTAGLEANPLQGFSARIGRGQVINLIRLPGSQQVLLKVRVAELNRSALRRIGANFLGVDPRTGAIVGTNIAAPLTASGTVASTSVGTNAARNLFGTALLPVTASSTVFGIFQDSSFEFTLNALRRNSMLKVLAEPNLVALHGHQASFLAGGEFPVPVPQVSAGGSSPTITVRFREFGVRLNFLPYILDGDVIRLSVAPEVSQIDFTIATTLVAGGSPVPGLNTRKAQTTVELREGQTLAIAGLMQLTLDGSTDRIPGLGDLPIIGPLFSNTTSERIEKELVVLVTPYLVEPMNKGQVPATPGDEVKGPNDLELFFLNRIEGRTGKDFRATTSWDDPLNLVRYLNLERKYLNGPSGFSD